MSGNPETYLRDFIDAMCAAGVRPAEPIEARLATGRPVRFQCEGDRPGRKNGWAMWHSEGRPAGVFRHYRLGIRQTWRADGDSRALTPQEQRALRDEIRRSEARRRADTEARQDEAREAACRMWREGKPADPAHPYLVRKGLRPSPAIRSCGPVLIVPMIDPARRLWNLQRIFPDASKRFLKGGRTEHLFWSTAEDGRGAIALRDAARVVLTLNPMSQSEAETLGVTDPSLRRSLVRIDTGKANRAPPDAATWIKLEGQCLDNDGDGAAAEGVRSTTWQSCPSQYAV